MVAALLALGLAVMAGRRLRRTVHVDEERPGEVAAWPDARIDPNTASEAELTLLPGIGPSLAGRIVADRAARGPFERIEDLDRVKWIGPSLIERMRPYLVIEEAPPAETPESTGR